VKRWRLPVACLNALERQAKGRKAFFFEKKKQKTFDSWGARAHKRAARMQKFFGSFFQKRTFFLVNQSTMSRANMA
jgi:hypothetical protein